ncbi:hypothetical protein C2845_PM05G31460 [Panicum miliaceum]|uniref:Uncharacterized protein n=1 Tax=Panicum miliaceum TaxID=4540 RepID=A0A3L6SW69_PANMI|nr:hypothetical protein C2845_PM05G31460 [Panicum miliaceum]
MQELVPLCYIQQLATQPSQARKKTVVLYPGLSVSHFVPMVQLADALLAEGYAVVAVAYIDPSLKGDITLPAVVDRLAASRPSVAFHRLPRIQDAPALAYGANFLASYHNFVGRFHEHLRDFLLSMPPGSVHALVVDMMSVGVLGATSELGIPGYTFFASNASALATHSGTGAGSHSAEQLKEMAIDLENSGHRFLWVVRAPPPSDPDQPFDTRADPDLDALLPEGFLGRTCGRGLVAKLWVLQVEVLRHAATGAFVTHCGWTVELGAGGDHRGRADALLASKMNKTFVVEEYGVGVEVLGWQQGMVRDRELETKVRLVMEAEEGERIRERVSEHREAAAMAWKGGGSSRAAFGQFLSDAGKPWLGIWTPRWSIIDDVIVT